VIPKECQRLAEVDFPIAVVSKHAAREKSIRHGRPSPLHLWLARRPLAFCRPVLLARLWLDPWDPLCPQEFRAEARRHLSDVAGRNPGTTDDRLADDTASLTIWRRAGSSASTSPSPRTASWQPASGWTCVRP
jgi:hypothetical protein